MKLVMPSLDFFGTLEQKASSSISLIDTNIAIPNFYDQNWIGIPREKFFDFLYDNCRAPGELQKTKRAAEKYARNYFKKLEEMLNKNLNITTVPMVIEEFRRGRQVYLNASRVSRDKSKIGKEQFFRNLMQAMFSVKKIIANGLERFLLILEGRAVYKAGCIGRRELYDEIFSEVNRKSKQIGIESNDLSTDQHLLTMAFYLSALGQTNINIFSFDSDIINLLKETHYKMLEISKNHKCSMPSISVYKPGYRDNKFVVKEFKANGRGYSEKVVDERIQN